jgi:ATP-dependent Clp protease protease subunit
MIHNAWTVTDGNADQLRKTADDLEKMTEPSIKAYVEASHLERDEIKAMMDAETWITAEEALEYGFATAIVDDNEAKQSFKDSVILGLVRKVKELERPAEQSNIDETPSSTGWFFHK